MTEPAKNPVSALLRRIWGYLKRYRTMTLAVIGLGAAEAFLTKAPLALAGVVMNVLFKSEASGATSRGSPGTARIEHVVRVFKERVLGPGELGDSDKWTMLVATVILIGLLSILGAVCMALFTYWSRILATRVVTDLKEAVTGHLLSLSLRFFSGRRMGDLLSRVTNDTATTMQAFNLTFENVIQDPFMILATILLLLFPVNVWLGIAALVLIPTFGVPLVTMGRSVRKSSAKSMRAMGESTEALTQMLSGIRTVKAFHLEQLQLQQFARSNTEFLRRTGQLLRKRSIAQAFTFLGYSVGFAALVLVIGWWSIKDPSKAGDLVMTLVGISTVYPNIKRLARAYQVLQESAGALDRLEEILRLDNDVPDRPLARDAGTITGRVEFERVSFAYADAPVLEDVSFAVDPGTTVALVGPSGAGKSTTLDLIARFYDPVAGVVRVDGYDLRDLKSSFYRRHLAVVSQQPFLFNTSIEENIRHGRPTATREEIEAAARAANIHDFVLGLPDGYATVVGERGSKLSGGQLQRITIARAILKDAAILLLDEATSALDSESEDLVQRALQNLMKGRTCFVIAHRLSTIRNAHRILVMDKGRIVQDGTHAELVGAEGMYRRLSELQGG